MKVQGFILLNTPTVGHVCDTVCERVYTYLLVVDMLFFWHFWEYIHTPEFSPFYSYIFDESMARSIYIQINLFNTQQIQQFYKTSW